MPKCKFKYLCGVILVYMLSLFLTGCVAIITVGEHNTMTTQDNDGTTSLTPKKGLLR